MLRITTIPELYEKLMTADMDRLIDAGVYLLVGYTVFTLICLVFIGVVFWRTFKAVNKRG